MAYDFAGPWTKSSGHHAQLHGPSHPHNEFAKRSVAGITKYLRERGVQPARVVVGVPAYGRSFTGVRGPGQEFTGHAGTADGTFEYSELPCDGATEYVDREAGAAWCLSKTSGWISYDNPETVQMKAEFVQREELGGMFFWTGSFDANDENRSLIVAARNVLHG